MLKYLGVPTLFQGNLLDKGIVLLTFAHNKRTNEQTIKQTIHLPAVGQSVLRVYDFVVVLCQMRQI
jgi:hypothetical protein